MTQNELLEHLELKIKETLETVRTQILPLSEALLRQRPDNDPKRWHALDCFEHLSRSLGDYLPQIELAIHKAKAHQWTAKNEAIRYTMLGKEALRWVNGKSPKSFKTVKRYNPVNGESPATAIKSFLIQTEQLLRLIQMAKAVDINKARVRFAVLPMLKYRMGNLLEFLVLHGERHVAQALRATSSVQV